MTPLEQVAHRYGRWQFRRGFAIGLGLGVLLGLTLGWWAGG